MMTFTVPGPPVPYTRMTQAQVRALGIPEHRRTTPLPKQIQRYLDYKQWVQAHAMNAHCEPVDGPVSLVVYIHVAGSTRRWDASNVYKGIEDSLNGLTYLDDKQVVSGAFIVVLNAGQDKVTVTVRGAS